MRKNIIVTLVLLGILIMSSLLYLFRYDITVHSPIIVKLNRLTGQTWVANSGVWMDIGHEAKK